MVEERSSYTDTLARLDERLKGVEARLNQPMRCVEGALVAQRLETVGKELKTLTAIREEDARTLANHGQRLQTLEEKTITTHEIRIQELEKKTRIQVAKIAAISALVGTVVTGAIQLVITLA